MSGKPERRLIVNADDLGMTSGVNDGIFAAHAQGIVTSATLMVNRPAAREAAARLADLPELGVGLHVALSGGRPTLEPARVPTLVGATGELPPRLEGLDEPDPGEILAEIRAQLARFCELAGRPPTHLDGHHHAHRRPDVGKALVTVAREHGVPVRRADAAVGERLRTAGVATTDFFEGSFFGDGATLGHLLEILRALPPGSTEVMCHPALPDDELRRVSSYAEERARELAALTDPGARRALEEANVRLIDFRDLGETR